MLKALYKALATLFLLPPLLCACTDDSSQKRAIESVPADSVSAIILHPSADSLLIPAEHGYIYYEEDDEMTDTKTRYARLVSDNSVTLDYPYGECHLSCLIRKSAKYGTEVMLRISSGLFQGDAYNENNYVCIRFDSSQAINYSFEESRDGSPEWIFLNNTQDFIRRAKRARSIKIEVPIFQEGRRLFRLTSDKPLEWL